MQSEWFYGKILKNHYCEQITKEELVIKDEFYHSKEYNFTTEFKRFPAELYIKSKEVVDSGKEFSQSAPEITTSSKPTTPTRAKSNTLTDKIFNSLKAAATTTTVAAAALVGSTMIPPATSVELLDLSVGANYVEYQMSVKEIQSDLQYFIVISGENKTEQEFLVQEDGVYQNRIDGLLPECEYSLSFVSYNDVWGKTTYFEEVFKTTTDVIIPNYQAGITAISVSGLNELCIEFWCENFDENADLELLLSCNDSQPTTLSITQKDLARGYVTTTVEENTIVVSAQPIVKYGENNQTIEFNAFEYDLSRSLDADIKVDTYNRKIIFYLKGITSGATYVNVVDTTTGSEILTQDVYEYYEEGLLIRYVEVSYEDETPIEYTIFLTDNEGEKTTDNFSAVVTPIAKDVGDYVFNYKNTGEVGITYNDDGTINVYISTNFETEDDGLYYQILLGDMIYQSRDPVFVAEGLKNTTYPLIYEICYDDNGVQYCISSISVSGVVNEFWFDGLIYAEFAENTALLSISDYQAEKIDLNSLRLVSSNGEEIRLTADAFVFDEGTWT